MKNLTRREFINDLYTLFEDQGPKIPHAQYFMGCIHPRKMTDHMLWSDSHQEHVWLPHELNIIVI
jgi:hypothetical protein